MARNTAKRALLVLAVLPLLIPLALGMDVAIQPTTMEDRGPIAITLSNVTNATLLNTTLVASFPPAPGVTWFNLTNWNYPFALQGGKVGLAGRNVNQLILLVRTGSTILMQRGSGAGSVDLGIQVDLQPFTYHDFRIGYEVHNGSIPLTFTLIQQGTKAGIADEAVLTPSIIGAADGSLAISVLANGTLVNTTGITVMKPGPPPTPPPVNTTATPTLTATPTATTEPATTPPAPSPSRTVPTPARITPTPAATPATPEVPSGGPSPVIIAYAIIIIIIALIGDYLLLRD